MVRSAVLFHIEQFVINASTETISLLIIFLGIAVAIVVGVAIVIGMLILTIGLVIFKR